MRVEHGERVDLAGPELRHAAVEVGDHDLDLAAEQIGHHHRIAAIGHADDVRAGPLLQRLHDDLRGAVADAVGQLAGIGLGVVHQRLHRLVRLVRRDRDERREAADPRNRGEILDRVVGHVLEQPVDHRMGRVGGEEQRVAVVAGASDRVGGEQAAGAGAVLDDDRLAERILQGLRDHPRGGVGDRARGERREDRDRPRRIGIGAECGWAKSQTGQQQRAGCGAVSWFHHRAAPSRPVPCD